MAHVLVTSEGGGAEDDVIPLVVEEEVHRTH